MNGSGNNSSCDIKVSLVFNEVLLIKAKNFFFTYNKSFAISTNSLIPAVFTTGSENGVKAEVNTLQNDIICAGCEYREHIKSIFIRI